MSKMMTAVATTEEVPLIKVDTALESLRSAGYGTPAAVGETIDNALEAGANNVRVQLVNAVRKVGKRAKEVSVVEEIAIGDDGSGMTEDVLMRSLVLGFSTRYDSRTGMGRFGVGATLGGISQARRITIYSRASTKLPYLMSYIDLDEIKAETQKHMPKPEVATIPDRYRALVGPDTGTLVVWSKCDRIAEGEDGTVTKIEDVKSQLRAWVSRTYRMFLDAGRKILIDGQSIEPHDPLYMMTIPRFKDDPKAEVLVDESFEWPVPSEPTRMSRVRVRMTMLPPQWRSKRGQGGSTFAHERRINENEGLSIVRADREIFFGLIPKFYSQGALDIDRWVGIEVGFDPDLDECFRVRNVKKGAEPIDQLRDKLKSVINQPLNTARNRVQKHYIEEENKQKATEAVHHDAEQIVAETQNTAPKAKAGTDVPEEEKKKRIKKGAETSGRPTESLEKLPYCVIDDHWPGKDFMTIEHLGANTIVRLNNRHPFFTRIYSKVLNASKGRGGEGGNGESMSPQEVQELARVVRLGLDLLLMAYAQAEGQNQHPEETYGDLRTNWGMFLHNTIERVPSRS